MNLITLLSLACDGREQWTEAQSELQDINLWLGQARDYHVIRRLLTIVGLWVRRQSLLNTPFRRATGPGSLFLPLLFTKQLDDWAPPAGTDGECDGAGFRRKLSQLLQGVIATKFLLRLLSVGLLRAFRVTLGKETQVEPKCSHRCPRI